MGDWSDYFEDFPEENPANYVGGRFDPLGAAAHRAQLARQQREQDALDSEINAIIKRHRKPSSENKPAKRTPAELEYLDRLHERAEELAGYLLSCLSRAPDDKRLERISEKACARAERRNQASIKAWREAQ